MRWSSHPAVSALASLFLISVLGAGCAPEELAAPIDGDLEVDADRVPHIPSQDEWTDHGTIVTAGGPGDWDLHLWGGFATTVVKRNGTYLFYYQGSDGFDDAEGTVSHRAIGVATSTNGIDFVKHEANPVLTWLPTNDVEEGAASGGAWVDPEGTVHIYYGANTATAPTLVSADARAASSSDGLGFVDEGLVLDHDDPSVWGSGDELFPVLGFREGSTWYAYYVPNGVSERAQLGVAWGPSKAELSSTAAVLSSGRNVHAWGPAGWARLSDSLYAVLVTTSSSGDEHLGSKHLDVYTVDPAAPNEFEGPIQRYVIPDLSHATLMLDHESGRWLLYYAQTPVDTYRVMTAPLSRQGLGSPSALAQPRPS